MGFFLESPNFRHLNRCKYLKTRAAGVGTFLSIDPSRTYELYSEGGEKVGTNPRWIVPHRAYELSIRTVDRCFLFRPNHDKRYPLLDAASSPKSLDPGNDIIPLPSIINIFGAAIGRALGKHPIRIHAIECSTNHIHIVFSVSEEQMNNVVPFFRQFLSTVARKINRLWDREGPVFGGRARIHPCLDDESASQKVLYSMTNPAKDNLIEKTAHSPFFSTYHHQAKGQSLKYWYIDYNAYYTAGGNRKKTHRLKDYLKWVTWQTTPLPEHQSMSESQRQTWFRKQVSTLDNHFSQARKESGHTVIGFEKLAKTDPRDRPKHPKTSGREPLCHCSDKEGRRDFRRKWRDFMNQFIPASADYRQGMRDREFPFGSIRPPLFDISMSGAP